MVYFFSRCVAAVVFFVLASLGGLLLVGIGEALFNAGRDVYVLHPIAPLVFGAIGAAYGFTRT
jgi:hypothetical protein